MGEINFYKEESGTVLKVDIIDFAWKNETSLGMHRRWEDISLEKDSMSKDMNKKVQQTKKLFCSPSLRGDSNWKDRLGIYGM